MGTIRMVASRARSSGMALVAMTPGMAQPPTYTPPRIRGSVDWPCNPNLRNSRSRMNAMRGMYPLSSRMAIRPNSRKKMGR